MNNFLIILVEGPTSDINGSFGSPKKKFSINFAETITKFCLYLHYNHVNSYLLFATGKEIYKINTDNKNVDFPTQFCLGRISRKCGTIHSREVSWKGKFYDFSVHCSAIEKSNMLNIHK